MLEDAAEQGTTRPAIEAIQRGEFQARGLDMAAARPLCVRFVPAVCLLALLMGTGARGETFHGTSGRDIVIGTPQRDIIYAYGGNDKIDSGPGDDFIRPGPGDDDVDGGAGNDTVDYVYATGPVDVDLAAGMATGADGSDTLVHIEAVGGSQFDDNLKGDATANVLKSSSGNDDIDGRGGDDVLGGGEGDDVFHLNLGNDRVEDFARGDDVLELHGLKDGSGRAIRAFADLDDTGDGRVTADDAVAEAAGGDLVLRFQEGSVTLVGVSLVEASDLRIVDVEPPICRNPIYETRTDPACGVKHYNRKRGQECGPESFNVGTGEVCGVASYNVGQSDVCGVDKYREAQSPLCGHESDGRELFFSSNITDLNYTDSYANSCRERGGYPEWLINGMASYSSRPSEDEVRTIFQYFYLKCFEAKVCRHPTFGVESYKSCEHPSFGPRSFHSCRHESFGVELYHECEHFNFGVREYNTCQKPEFGVIGCAD